MISTGDHINSPKSVVLFINKSDFGRNAQPIIRQLLRSATSIGANIVEGRSGNSRSVMINHYSIALRSSNETKFWLCLVRDTTDCDKTEVAALLEEAVQLSKILGKAIITLKQQR